MKRITTIYWAIFSLAIIAVALQSCKKDEPQPAQGIDLQLYQMALETAGFTWYKNSDELLDKSACPKEKCEY